MVTSKSKVLWSYYDCLNITLLRTCAKASKRAKTFHGTSLHLTVYFVTLFVIPNTINAVDSTLFCTANVGYCVTAVWCGRAIANDYSAFTNCSVCCCSAVFTDTT